MKYFISANWKMNKTVAETNEFMLSFIPLVKDADGVDIVIAPPFTSLVSANDRNRMFSGKKRGRLQGRSPRQC